MEVLVPPLSTPQAVRAEFTRDAQVWNTSQERFISFPRCTRLEARLMRINPVRRVLVLDTPHGMLLVNAEDVRLNARGTGSAEAA